MNFDQIELTNWGPYRGTHELQLNPTDSAPITLIFGENGKGKTSLAKAVLWCLFGKESKVQGGQYANWTTIKQKDAFRVCVKLVLSINAQTSDSADPGKITTRRAELTRSFRAKPDNRTRLNVLIEDETVSLVVGDDPPIPQDLIKSWISRHLPLEMARFFLFDGEELNSIKNDLESGTTSTIQSSIDSVLGIPAIEDLHDLVEKEQKKVDLQIGQNAKTAAERERLARLQEHIEALEKSREETRSELSDTEKQIEEIIKEIDQNDDARIKFENRDTLKKLLKTHRSDLRGIQDEIKDFLGDNWWIPLAERIDVAQQREQDRSVKSAQQSRLRDRISSLRSSLERGSCATCGQALIDHSQISNEIKKLEDEFAETGPEDEIEATSFKRFGDPKVERVRIQSLFKEARSKRTPIAELENDIGDIEIDVTDDDIERWRGLPSKRINLEKHVDNLKRAIEDTSLQISEHRTKLLDERKKIRGDAGLPSDLENRSTAISQLDSIVQHVLNDFRKLVRDEVEKVASENWRAMINNPDLTKLQITEDYQVRAYNASIDEWKPASSFGQSLIAVYAFVGALIEVSGHDGAWMIDTIGSRLDADKMRSVWQWLSSRNRQLIALPHSGELTMEDAPLLLGSRISSAYEIVPNEAQDADSRFRKIEAWK